MAKISVKQAIEIVNRGEAAEYVEGFVRAVKFSATTGDSLALNLSDALVVACVLRQLMEQSDYRKLMKKPKRKNLQYRVEDFGLFSQEGLIARELSDGNIFYGEAMDKLEICLADRSIELDRERTIKRLLDDLLERERQFRNSCSAMLIAAGDDGTPENKEKAVAKIFAGLGYPLPHP